MAPPPGPGGVIIMGDLWKLPWGDIPPPGDGTLNEPCAGDRPMGGPWIAARLEPERSRRAWRSLRRRYHHNPPRLTAKVAMTTPTMMPMPVHMLSVREPGKAVWHLRARERQSLCFRWDDVGRARGNARIAGCKSQ